MKITAVIPAYNEEKTIGGVVQSALPFVSEVIVVDDGSGDRTAEFAARSGARVVRHSVNRGLGGALGTGIQAALGRGSDIIITLDADGQHDAGEIKKLARPILRGYADVVIGSRMLAAEGMPAIRRIANHIGNLVTFLTVGAWVTDSQSGFRAFSRQAASVLNLRSNKMEVSSEIAGAIYREGLRLAEMPVRAIYTEYSLSKGQSFVVGLKTFYKLLLRRIGR